MHTFRFSSLVIALAALCPCAVAHDFWIEASSYRPAKNDLVTLDLKVGEHFAGESVARNPERIVRFVALAADGKDETILGVDGRAPAGMWRPKGDGLFVVGYRSNSTRIELEAAKFEAYLAAEGLDPVLAARKASNSGAKPGLELYSRSVKTLVCVGETPKLGASTLTGFDQEIGLRLEIIPEKNPYALKIGDELPLRVEFDDKPLAQALVGFMSHTTPKGEVRLRTDAEGRVKFKIAEDGLALARVCWMVAAPKDSGADWESTWASLTFEIPRAPAPLPAK